MGEFIGHMHPALVHMPIGFILLSVLSDWYLNRQGYASAAKVSTFMWGFSFLSCIAALATGTVLLMSGYFEGKHMFLHLLSGWGIMIVTTLLFLSKWKNKTYFKLQNTILKATAVVLLLVSGHNGGILTHGENYLPVPFASGDKTILEDLDALDSINVYAHILAPIFEEKCFRCHEVDDARGKLDMTSVEGLTDDTYGDPGIFAGNLKDSEIYKRVTMEADEHKYMPPSGPVMSYDEIKLLEWWILSGASFEKDLRLMDVDPGMKEFFLEKYGIDLRQKTFYEKTTVDPVKQDILDNIKASDFNVSLLASTNNFIDVSRVGHDDQVTSEQLSSLLQAKDQITWLGLGATSISDDDVKIIAQLKNLTKLKLQKTSISDESMKLIANELKHLSVLNVYGTQITDEGLAHLSGMTSLKQLYIWQTQTTAEGIEELKRSLSDVEVVSGQ